jgi:acetyl-CoA carboxylase carboxyltransferase component
MPKHAQAQTAIISLVAGDGYVAPRMDPAVVSDCRIDPLQRLRLLCDENSLHLIRSSVISDRMGDKACPGDGVVAAGGHIGGHPVFCFAQDASFAGGSVGAAHADTIVRVLRLARQAGVPVKASPARGPSVALRRQA